MSNNLDSLLEAMTLEEQVSLLSGQDFWSVAGIERLGIGELRVTDGPNGSRGAGSLIDGVKSACFPCGIALGATWSPELLYEVGAALADEVQSKGAHMLLAPTVNLQRTATNGRNFECYSEDAVLTAQLAVNYIKGLQAQGIAATVKHFAGNESEFERTTINSVIDERTLREHYLYPFEVAVKEANTWGVMSSYNKLNGVHTAENNWLLSHVLREQWGYDGMVMSDWFGSHSTVETIKAGLNLEMPGPTRDRGDKLLQAVNEGLVTREDIQAVTRDMLLLMERVAVVQKDGVLFKEGVLQPVSERHEQAINLPQHRELIRRAGAEASVLLKNEGILPVKNHQARIAVIGPNGKQAQIMGGGSAQLNPHYAVSPYQGIAAQLVESQLDYAEGCSNHRYQPTLTGDFTAEYFTSADFSGEPAYVDTLQKIHDFFTDNVAEGKVESNQFTLRMTGRYLARHTAEYLVGAYAAGFIRVYVDGSLVVDAWGDKWQRGNTFFADGCDEVIARVPMVAGQTYDILIEFACLPDKKLVQGGYHVGIAKPTLDEDIRAAVNISRQADIAVLFVGRNGEWDTEGCDLPNISLPGRQDELIKAVAAVNPNTVVVLQTGGPVEMPWLDQVKAILQCWYPGQEAGNAIADILLGVQEPGGRLPQTFPVKLADTPIHGKGRGVYPGENGAVHYAEGELFGYRHYDLNKIEPLFPFGHGLGYTTFSLSNTRVKTNSSAYELTVDVSNTGDRDGQAIVQAYISPPPHRLERAWQALKAFSKVRVQQGKSKALTLMLSLRDFAYFDVELGKWKVPAGEYTINLGFSSRDSKECITISIVEDHILPV